MNFFSEILQPIGAKSIEHAQLVGLSTLIATLIGIPLGLLIQRRPALVGVTFGATGVVQTIPSIAMLALLLPLLGIGMTNAVTALALYALLPIVRNTYIGLREIDANVLEAADGLGLNARQKLFWVELPLALPVIIGGVRTATVICVGVATLSAFIGAGGLGDFIVQGLSLNNNRLLLMGAIPAAIMALAVDFGLGRVERALSWRDSSEF